MTNVYRIGVSIAMANGVSPVLGVIARDMLGLHGNVSKLEQGFSRLKLAIGGALAVAGGAALIGMFKRPMDEAAKFQTQLARFKQFGMADSINQGAENYARAAKVMGSSATDMMRYMVEAQGVFRESGQLTVNQALLGSRIAAPILAKIAFANSSLSDEDRARYHNQDLMMLRFIEARGGANDPASFARIADWGYKLITSSGGNINWDQLRGLVKTAGAAGFNLKEDAISKLEPVITDMGGSSVGSGLRVAFQRLLGTQRGLPKQAVQEYLSLGAWDATKVELTKSGAIKRFLGAPGAVLRDRDKFATDPIGYYVEDFLPMISRKYGRQIIGDTTSARTKRAAEISMFFGPGTAGNLFSQIDKLLPAIQRSVAAQNKALGIDAADKNAAATKLGKALILQKNWQTLMLQLGEHVLPIAIQGLTLLNGAIEKVSAWAARNPGKVDLIVKSILVVGAALIGFGAVAVAAAAVGAIVAGGWVAAAVAGLAALAGGITAFAVVNWDSIKSAADGVWNFTKRIADIAAFILANPALAAFQAARAMLPGHLVRPTTAQEAALAHQAARSNPFLKQDVRAGEPRFDFSPRGFLAGDFGGALTRPSAAPVGPPANQNTTVHTQVNLDGRQIAKVVTHHQARAIGSTATSSGRPDPNAALPPAAAGY